MISEAESKSQPSSVPAPLALSPAAAALKPPAAPGPQANLRSDRGGAAVAENPPQEVGGPKGPEPTRFGDWERKGRCSDF
ncbi:MAG: DUF1674 domain-containing protein [Rhodospirillaceae bacterium]|nr:DUF1674 domain-containing protein [Rhodospirillaceae bacterium]